jgi:hypothetical protein
MVQEPAETTDVEPAEVRQNEVRQSEVRQPPQASMLFPPERAVPSSANIKGTMVISQDEDAVVAAYEPKAVGVPQDVQREEEMRLEYLCRLILKARQPLAPINGVLTLLPYHSVQRGGREGTEVQRVVQRDIHTLVRTMKVRCPVVALVIGMEEESGFRELMRRLGRDVTTNQRIGKGFQMGNPPIPEQLEAVATHACGLFEGKVYELFRQKGSIENPGNRKLYALLCKIRRTVRMPLTNVLANGYGHDPDVGDDEIEPLFFSGCYFAASGESDDRQGFIKAVFDKLPAEQEELQWTEAALQDDDNYRRWSQTAVWIDGLLLLSLVGMLGYYLFFTGR